MNLPSEDTCDSQAASDEQAPRSHLQDLRDLGYSEEEARAALNDSHGDFDGALDILEQMEHDEYDSY